MKNLAIGCGAALLIFLVFIGVIGFTVYNTYTTFPEYAKRDVVYEKYADLIRQIDENIEKSDTILNLASNLEKMDLPENTLYMALEKEGDNDSFSSNDQNTLEIINRHDSGSKSITIMNGAGYGTIGNKNVLIIQYGIDKFDGLENCTIYLERHD